MTPPPPSSLAARVLPALALVLVSLPAASPAGAGLYKCAGDQAAVIYQDTPCAAGRELRNLELDPARLSVVPGTPIPHDSPARESSASRPPKARATVAKTRSGDPGERKFLRMGMTEAEVLHRIGKPDTRAGSGRSERQWSYLPVAGDADTLTTVTFVGGTVSRVERRVVR
ncbi:MAG TPA: hypothetical protein VMN79_02420 [Casimicrobiaceae bacterium]|nr:hypothetical protein [Casimicrobiaceae bacterium]